MIRERTTAERIPRSAKPPATDQRQGLPVPDVLPLVRQTGQWIGDHPTLSVALAIAMGVTAGWWIKRR